MEEKKVCRSYQDLEIYSISYSLALKVHHLTLSLPKYELYEQGNQVRRSSKSVAANIVEGYGRKRYKSEFIRFLVFSHASCDETVLHLKMINELHIENQEWHLLIDEYTKLSRMIFHFIQYVEKNWLLK
jgi:four helix bundle protein